MNLMSSLPGFDTLSQGAHQHPGVYEKEAKPRLKPINRKQLLLRPVDVENLVPRDHAVRAIWEITGRIDLTPYYQCIKAVQGKAGSTAFDPRLLICIWVYSYSKGIGSAREISKLIEYHPAYQWLTGMEPINYHTLSDFRVAGRDALHDLFVDVLGILFGEGLVTLEQVMQDGTKVKASAGSDSFRREEKIKFCLEAAEEQVKRVEESPGEEMSPRIEKARERAARERKEKLAQALSELAKIRETKSSAEDKENARASMTDPEARTMKQSDGGYAPSYNLQISTDSAHGIIVAEAVSKRADDYKELMPAVERIEENTGKAPSHLVADGGFTSKGNVIAMEGRCIDFIGSLQERNSRGQFEKRGVDPAFHPERFTYDQDTGAYVCPQGKILTCTRKDEHIGKTDFIYKARREDCRSCLYKDKCCPGEKVSKRSLVRSVDDPVILAFMKKMETEEAKAIYRKRGAIAEFPNAWIKDKLGLRQFHLRGLMKVGMEATWACLTYNIQQWIRLVWRPGLV